MQNLWNALQTGLVAFATLQVNLQQTFYPSVDTGPSNFVIEEILNAIMIAAGIVAAVAESPAVGLISISIIGALNGYIYSLSSQDASISRISDMENM
jgi:hypothetical protein